MCDYSELKRLVAQGSLPPVVAELIAENKRLREDPGMRAIRSLRGDCADLMAERDQLKTENERLRSGMKGDYDLDAWLDWTKEADGLRLRCDRLEADKQALADTRVLYTWLRKKCGQPRNDVVAVQMNIGSDWVPVHDLDRDLWAMIDREEP